MSLLSVKASGKSLFFGSDCT